MTNTTPENQLIEFFDRPGPNRIRTADIHRAIERLDEDPSEEAKGAVASGVNFFAHEAGEFLCYRVMQVPEEDREEEAARVLALVADAADTMVFGPEHPQGVVPEHPDAHVLIDEIVPDEGITGDLVQKSSWRSRIRELIGSVVETDIGIHLTA